MKDGQVVITLLGSAGGVAKSVLSLLNQTVNDVNAPLKHLITNSTIHLIDLQQKKRDYYTTLFPHLKNNLVLHELNLTKIEQFKNHLRKTKTNVVIDVARADTVKMLECCNHLGIKYVNSAIEKTFVDENESLYQGVALLERIQFLEKYKYSCSNTTAIIGSGMNPGVVQWMALELMSQTPEEKPLGCYIVEQDTTFFKDKTKAKKETIYTTWSPEGFLDEAIDNYPMFMQHHTPLFLFEDVYNLAFKVTLGNKQFNGCLMAHEEVYALGKLFDMETGFIYQVNDHTTDLIRSHLDNLEELWNLDMQVLDPFEEELEGEDLVGVLLVYPDRERYMYNVLGTQDIFKSHKTNTTYFQVASGIYAALSVLLLDSIPKGAYYVDELLVNTQNKYSQYLKYHLSDFVTGTNPQSDGMLLERLINTAEQ